MNRKPRGMIRISATGQTGLCQINPRRRHVEKHHILFRIDRIRIVKQFKILEDTAIRRHPGFQDIRRNGDQFRLFFLCGFCGFDRSGNRCGRFVFSRYGFFYRYFRQAGIRIRLFGFVLENHRRADTIYLPVIPKHKQRYRQNQQ